MSVTNKSKRRGMILDEIMSHHRERLPKLMEQTPIEDLRALAAAMPATVDFEAALRLLGVSLIAECKKASPSKGLIARRYDPVQLARNYVAGGARAISILTDGRHFQGNLTHLRDAKEAIAGNSPAIPILRKDFLFHPYHIYESRAVGADAILLIATVLSRKEMEKLYRLANKLGLAVLFEAHAKEDLDKILPLQPKIIGVNNRNLQTFVVDFDNAARLRHHIPPEIVMVGESGIKNGADVIKMRQIGVDAVLVGETLMRSPDVIAKSKELSAAGIEQKG